MKDTIIAIPSYGRADWMLYGENTALHNISSEYMKKTWLVVREHELFSYAPVAAKFGCNIRAIPLELYKDKEYGIRETRDFIFDEFLYSCTYLLMMEDDQRIDYRRDNEGHYKKMEDIETQFPQCMALLETADADIPVTSILPRLFCIQKAGRDTVMNGDCIQLTMFFAPFFREHKEYRYAFGPKYMEDFVFLLKLMHAGYGCLVYCQFVKQDVLNSKRTEIFGGCNLLGRTLSELDKAAIYVATKYPRYVQTYEKIRPSTWGSEPTIGLKIAYSKLAALYKGHAI